MDLSTKYGFKKTLEIYRACTEEKHSFMLYDAHENKFFLRFEYEVKVGSTDDSQHQAAIQA